MLKLQGLINGHYECRSLDETLPVFEGLLAAEVVERWDAGAVVKHPNTGWRLIVHEGGPGAALKPSGNHYGFRVSDHTEVEAAWAYISKHKREYGIKTLTKPQGSHFAYSVYLREPGGNTLEIEYYNPRAADHGRQIAAPHWEVLGLDIVGGGQRSTYIGTPARPGTSSCCPPSAAATCRRSTVLR